MPEKKLEQAAPPQQLHSSHNKITLEQFLKKNLKEDHFANRRPTSPLQVMQFRMICEMVIVVQFMYDGYSIVQRREKLTSDQYQNCCMRYFQSFVCKPLKCLNIHTFKNIDLISVQQQLLCFWIFLIIGLLFVDAS